jgi:uncharacterized SAM-binding protein YcdF (DUF218 family)
MILRVTPAFRGRGRLAGTFGLVALVVVLALGVSFAWFVHLVSKPGETPSHTDGIVAFTGGAERVETALRLLAKGRADRLLLSGIGGGAELAELARRAGVDPLPLATRVTIDRSATTTRGNAVETAAWAHANGIRSLVVVTSSYHMPRAITEVARALPETALYPQPVGPSERNEGTGLPLRLMAEEYVKFIATTVGLSAVLPVREPPPVRVGGTG